MSVPALETRKRQEDSSIQGHPRLHSKSAASLGYMTLSQKEGWGSDGEKEEGWEEERKEEKWEEGEEREGLNSFVQQFPEFSR